MKGAHVEGGIIIYLTQHKKMANKLEAVKIADRIIL